MTATATKLTTADLDSFTDRDEWLGFGYIGARKNGLEAAAAGEPGFTVERIAVADEMVLFHANRVGWTVDQLFEFANSKAGRWVGDLLIGSDLDSRTDGLVRKYMGVSPMVQTP